MASETLLVLAEPIGKLSADEVAEVAASGLGKAGWQCEIGTLDSDRSKYVKQLPSVASLVVVAPRLDQETTAGTPLARAATEARQHGVPTHAVVGQCTLSAFGLRQLDLQHVEETHADASGKKISAAGGQLGKRLYVEFNR